MPIYQYECKHDGEQEEVTLSLQEYELVKNMPRVCSSGHMMTRVFSFTTNVETTRFEPHMSIATGEEVSSKRDLTEQLKKLSDETSARMGGMKVDLVPVDARELRHTVKGDGRAESYAERKRTTPSTGGFVDAKDLKTHFPRVARSE